MKSEFQYRTPTTSPASDHCISVTSVASSSSRDVRAPLDTSEETVARKIKDQDEKTEHDNDSQTISTGLESSSGDVAESDSTDELHKNHSAGLEKGKEGGRQGGGKSGLVKSGSEASLTSYHEAGDVKTSILLHRQVKCAFKVGSNSKTENNQVEGHAGMGDEKEGEDQESEYDLVDDIGRFANNA